MDEYEKQNAESVALVRTGQRLPRKRCYFVPEGKYHYLIGLEAAYAEAERQLMNTRFACVALGALAVIGVAVGLLA